MIRRMMVILLFFGLAAAAVAVGWGRLKERYIIPWVGTQLARTIETRTGWRLGYGSIRSRLLSECDLYAVRLHPSPAAKAVGPYAADLLLSADQVHVDYSLLDLLRRRIHRLTVERPLLTVGQAHLAFSVAHIGETTAIEVPSQRVSLEEMHQVFRVPERMELRGTVTVAAQILLHDLHPQLMRAQVNGQDLRVGWGGAFTAKTDVALEVSGDPARPALSGQVDVRQGRWIGLGRLPIGAGRGERKPLYLKIADRYPGAMRLKVRGKSVSVQTDQLRLKATGDLTLQKEADAPARMVGLVQAVEGTYTVHNLRFRILNGTITFPDRPNEPPQLAALLETRMKRYRIRAAMSGTTRDSRLRLTSQPDLPRQDILALLVFGRPLNRLDEDQREQLTQQDMDAQALDLLFLGRAEVLAARWLWLDEINVNVSADAFGASRDPARPGEAFTGPSGAPLSPIESVEVGKYVIPDRLFGSYQLEPGHLPGEAPKHTLGAEYELSDTVSVGATVKGGMAQDPQALLDTEAQPRRRLAAEEAFIRFRWKF